MSDTRAGLCSLTVDGINYDVDDVRADPSNLKREVLYGQSGAAGNSVMPKPGSISAKVRDAADLSVRSFQDMTSVSVICVTASGKSYSGNSLTQTADNLEVDTKDGTFEVKFEGEVEEG